MSCEKRAVLVTTVHRGVYFGFLESDESREKVVLSHCRCAIYWNTKHGVLELASEGPNSGSKVGAQAERVTLYDITSIADVSDEAAEKWLSV